MVTNMREMKDSCIEWVGKIPKDWKLVPIRAVFEEVTNKNFNGSVKNALKFTYDEIVPKTNFEADDDDYVANTILNYTVVEPGTIMLNGLNLNFDFVSQRIGLVKDKGVITSAYMAFKPTDGNVSPEFATYLFKAYDGCKALHNMGGGVRKILNFNEFKRYYVAFPALDEQRKIVCFIDSKCAEIDALSADIQSEIDTLEAYKRSVITEAVTKGLDKNVPMKDSGMPWIGRVPSHWAVEKVKYHLQRYEVRNPGNQQILSVYREYGVIPKDSRDDNHNVTSEDTSKYKYVRPGDLAINKMKAWQGSMGVSEYEGVVSPAYFIYRFTDSLIIPKYLHYLFRSCYKDEFRRISGGIREGQWDLSPEAFNNTMLLLPPLDEQVAIIKYISEKVTEIEAIIDQKKEQITILANYKKSIIYEYVTGKKEVPIND